ncbi:hypothetical protein F8M41_009638 [Gigaspora margarita]|uniref:Uncharacterized protein n=1 Tax=Gigaspora margarita TaxID=4874 RepID=A0A8H3X2Q3_GIGMA|nr:hypothetical protein F8M41_009638 [Gigaspora margarita]
MRAQMLEFSTVRLEAYNLKEKPCAIIHDNEFVFFSEKCVQKFEDSSLRSPGYDSFLNIERFKYSTNVSDVFIYDLGLKDLFKDQDIAAALGRRYLKLPFSSHPGWGMCSARAEKDT